jgi:large subunit ribosomal protein L4
MAKLTIQNMSGEKVGDVELRTSVFEIEANIPLMHQMVVAEEANSRQGNADTKNRSEVSGGGKKPFRQKGTGRARQGSIRAPHQRHGGVAFGPTPRSYTKAAPKKMRRAAMASALSSRIADGDMIIVDSIKMDTVSTKNMVAFLKKIADAAKVLIIVDELSREVYLSARNIQGLELRTAPAFSVRDILNAEKIIMSQGAVNKIEEVLAK